MASYCPNQIPVLSVNQINTAVDFINGHFNKIKRNVELRRVDLIQRIENYSEEIMKSVESTQQKYLKMSKEVDQLTVEVEKSTSSLNSLVNKFEVFEKKPKSLVGFDECLSKVLEEYKESLLGFSKYSFDFKEIDIKEVFGYLSETEQVRGKLFIYFETIIRFFIDFKFKFDSNIMNIELQKQLVNLCEFSVGQEWDLKYRASRDSFKSTDFHSKCDGIANTLTVIKAKSGNVFGGFTEKEWHSSCGFVTDPNAFIFSLVNKEDKPFKALCSNEGQLATLCDSRCGPCFGGRGTLAKDFCIYSDSNSKKISYSDFGYSYQHPDYLKGTFKAKNILAGSYSFETLEIEVFAKSN